MNIDLFDPAKLRRQLEELRADGASWQEAWDQVSAMVPAGDRGRFKTFIHAHFRAGYLNLPLTGTGDFGGREAIATDGREWGADRRPLSSSESDEWPRAGLCRSGDRCDAPATHGRFGAWWCEKHGRELDAISGRTTSPAFA